MECPLPDLWVSPLGLVPTKEPNKIRLIHHLSYPAGGSVNDGIADELCSVSYTSFDAAVRWVQRFGQGALLAKMDIEAAFRLLPIHPDSLHLLGFQWEGCFYVDCCLPMGCAISCSLFDSFSSFLEWVVKQEAGWNSVLHYLDDFLFLGPAESRVCAILLHTMERVGARFGIPLAAEKTEGPSTVITFLGIEIDSVAMECRLPENKVSDLLNEVVFLRGAKKVQLRRVQSVLGKLNFACRILPMGWVFCRCLALVTAGVTAPFHYLRIPAAVKADLAVWESFLLEYNGRSIWMGAAISSADLDLFSDASGWCGYAVYCRWQWSAEAWPVEWKQADFLSNLVLLELFPIVLATELWGDWLRNRRVRFYCDNMGVVRAINSQTANSPPVLNLLRHLVLRGLRLNACFVSVHVPGVNNSLADSLSRFQWDRFRSLPPGAGVQGLPSPQWFWSVALGFQET
ncbi:uncharacterized protein LOC120989530 [Bufo bufo]|uniref:uncharacterized protein LOC120989530 n=1 Tax=Bufo bufo TaxID=8384 RepID=UPI001ABE1447|nr:uncharacterized protein LOC120989530 [Bufo bufo]